jgi:hypothetical protein
MWFDVPENQSEESKALNYDDIYAKFTSAEVISPGKREDFINEDPATKSNQKAVNTIQRIISGTKVFTEVSANLSDDIMNLIDVAAALKSNKPTQPPELLAVLLMNKHCYIQNPFA